MLTKLVHLVRNLVRRRAVDRDLDAELDAYVELLTDEELARGRSTAEARRAARLAAGSIEDTKERVRDVRAGARIEQLARDVRFGLRNMLRTPGYWILALFTLALGIGGTTVVFSLVQAALLRPLPYPHPDRLVMVLEASAENPDPRGGFAVAAPNYMDWERLAPDLFQRMALYEYQGFNLSGEYEPESVSGLRATAGLFEVLGAAPLLGRTFTPEEEVLGRDRVVVLSHGLWQRRYGGDSGIVARTIRINQAPYTVAGVMPQSFTFPGRNQELWVPIGLNAEDTGRASHSFFAVARLRPDVTVPHARARMETIGAQLARQYPADNYGETVSVFPMRDLWMADAQEMIQTLFAAVGLVLLIACVNVAGLHLARGTARRHELAVRLALGGSRARLVQQLVTESVLLSLLGAAVALGLAAVTLPALVDILPWGIRTAPFRDLGAVSLDPSVFGFVALVALVVGVLSGIAPAFQVLPSGPNEVLKESEARGTTARRGHRLRSALVSAEVAIALVVLTGAGLLVESLRRTLAVDPGLNPTNVVAMEIVLPQPDFYGPPVRTQFCDGLEREASAIPGLTAVSAASHLPLSGANAGRSFVVEGRPDPGTEIPSASYGVICPGFFRTMGIGLVKGRDFTMADRVGAPEVAIVNQALAHRFFPNEDPVGRRMKLGRYTSDGPWITIVGVATDVHHWGLQVEPESYFYRPYSQAAWPSLGVVARAERDAPALGAQMREALHRLEPEQAVSGTQLMTDVVARSVGNLRFPMLLFVAFAGMSILLAAAGIFGVASQAVVQRTRELGIRKAIGARPLSLYLLVLRRSMLPVAVGVGLGLGGAVATTRLLGSLLFRIAPTDLPTLTAGALLLGLVALAASLVPARRAARLDPVRVLREE